MVDVPFEEGCWVDKTTEDFFGGKRVVLNRLSEHLLTPTLHPKQLPVDLNLTQKRLRAWA